MGEISSIQEIAEMKNPDTESFKEIKPEGNISPEEARRFFDHLFEKYDETKDSVDFDTEKTKIKDETDDMHEAGTGAAEAVELSIEEKQKIADDAAQKYNEEKKPYERAVAKGVQGVTETKNGGVSFAESDSLYVTDDGKKAIVSIEATGNRTKDFDAANKEMKFDETPEGYVWHHVDDYDVEKGTITLELVEDEAHNESKPHSGGCAQYDAVNGPSYNPPRKEVANGV